ncbi:MAG: Sll0314/Alr1548 family TPR repeat-containing protein [Geitlerinemataceae cyanobacterium]
MSEVTQIVIFLLQELGITRRGVPMKNRRFRLNQTISTMVGAAVLSLGLGNAPTLAGDPFRESDPHAIGSRTEEAFNYMFQDGNYPKALESVDKALAEEPNEPMIPALKASLIFLEDDSDSAWEVFKPYATQTRETAEKLTETDPLRGHLYTAVGHFLEGAYTLKTEGTVRGTPQALAKLRQVFQNLDDAAKIDEADPELNIIKGFMDLMLAVNLPFANANESIDRLRNYAGPDYLAYRGLAIGYRDLDQPEDAMVEVDEALKLTPNNPEVKYLKAQIFVEQGKHEDSLKYFEEAWKLKNQLPGEIRHQLKRECNKAAREVAKPEPCQ